MYFNHPLAPPFGVLQASANTVESTWRRLGIARPLSRSTRLALAFFGKALVERTKIDHHALMSSAADLFLLVARGHLKFDPSSLDLDYLGFGTNIVTYGCSGKMPYIYRGTDRALTYIQKWPYGAEGGVFHDQDHHGGR